MKKRLIVFVLLTPMLLLFSYCHRGAEGPVQAPEINLQWGTTTTTTTTTPPAEPGQQKVTYSMPKKIVVDDLVKGTQSSMDFTYDSNNQLTEMKDQTSTNKFEYGNGRVSSITVTMPVIGITYTFTYDQGKLVSKKQTDQTTTYEWNYSYNAAPPWVRTGTGVRNGAACCKEEVDYNDKGLPTKQVVEMAFGIVTRKTEQLITYTADGMMDTLTTTNYENNVVKDSSKVQNTYANGKPSSSLIIYYDANNKETSRKQLTPTPTENVITKESIDLSTDGGATSKPNEIRTFTYDTVDKQPLLPPLELLVIGRPGPIFTLWNQGKPDLYFDKP